MSGRMVHPHNSGVFRYYGLTFLNEFNCFVAAHTRPKEFTNETMNI